MSTSRLTCSELYKTSSDAKTTRHGVADTATQQPGCDHNNGQTASTSNQHSRCLPPDTWDVLERLVATAADNKMSFHACVGRRCLCFYCQVTVTTATKCSE